MKLAKSSTRTTDFVAAPTDERALGVLVDEGSASVFACWVSTHPSWPGASGVRQVDLNTGALKSNYDLPAPAFCNDLTLDGQHNLYVADSSGKVFVLPNGSTRLSVWSDDAQLAPSSPGGFGADGIVWDGQSSIYVNTFSDNRILRIPINADGTAGAATALSVSPPLNGPDGMRMLDANTLLLVEQNAGHLTKVSTATGQATVLFEGLDAPTSVVKSGDSFWVTEGQLKHILDPSSGPPNLPFKLHRLPAH